jgi:hypothetical protein
VDHRTLGGRGEEDREGNIQGENGWNSMIDWRKEIRNWLGLGGVLKRTVWWPSGQVWDWQCCVGHFVHPWREWVRGFHDWLRRRLSSLFMLFGCSSISMASLIIWSMYLDLVDRMVVSWSWMQWFRLMLRSTMAYLSGCCRWMWQWFSLINFYHTTRRYNPEDNHLYKT